MSSQVAKGVVRQVKPILSLDRSEARRRALNLYKAWYRQIPYTVHKFDIEKNVAQCRQKLREEFDKHRNVSDVRVIDLLIIKGQMELQEIVNHWKQKNHIMAYWRDTAEPKPKDFLSKFLSGSE